MGLNCVCMIRSTCTDKLWRAEGTCRPTGIVEEGANGMKETKNAKVNKVKKHK